MATNGAVSVRIQGESGDLLDLETTLRQLALARNVAALTQVSA